MRIPATTRRPHRSRTPGTRHRRPRRRTASASPHFAAIILGFVARGRVKRGQATNGGVAIAGIVLGVLAILVALVFIPIWYGMFNEVGGSDYVDCVSKAGQDGAAIQKCADQFRDRVENQFSVTITPTP